MKITIVAFDLWGFNKKIVEHLKNKGAEVNFIDSSKIHFTYKSKSQRIKNFFSKTFLNKNIKKNYRHNTVLSLIERLEMQDVILIVNPDHFRPEIVNNLKLKTRKYIAYNYDSLARNPLPENYLELFDTVFSFDINDLKKNPRLKPLTNFNYLDKKINDKPQTKAFIILLHSLEREVILKRIADNLDEQNITNYEFIVVDPALKNTNKNIIQLENPLSLDIIYDKMDNSEILIDLVRENQSGLSFRFFEAMALHKKIITNNQAILEYDFYNENNILLIDDNFSKIPSSFLSSSYTKLPENIYEKYTLNTWVKNVFGI
ncbi:hypothetical protein MG290_04950 [Flavobacterium sp. CBA20B-1]|uniref:hypothetical protein n=1 Tax=unclassified Flavobacterium TaxID=196869 RepID=UPI0022254940|nr:MULTISPECIES: hypothetical protein [unclassified Flavobacterium]WCM43023.1 hypothetical protein MG290_04950 [Flavobacterium sp. CBA20B-1]